MLDEVLKGERLSPLEPRLEPILPPPEFLPPLDLYLMEIEERMEKLYGFLCRLAAEGKMVVFSKVVAGAGKLEAVKTFIVLLFLAQRGKVSLWQEENFGELYITLLGGPTVDGKGTGII